MLGRLICIEGGEGAGKSTQVDLIAKWLPSRIGNRVISTREPGGTSLGDGLRKMLLWMDEDIQPIAELFLYASDRVQHNERVIKPALRDGNYVLCDRGAASTFAYQGYGNGVDLEIIAKVNGLTDAIFPDLTIWLDIDPEVGLARSGKSDRFEKKDIEFHRRVREGYQAYADTHKNVVKIDASGEPEEVSQRIQWVISSRLFLWSQGR